MYLVIVEVSGASQVPGWSTVNGKLKKNIPLVFKKSPGRTYISCVWGPVHTSVVLNSGCMNVTSGAHGGKHALGHFRQSLETEPRYQVQVVSHFSEGHHCFLKLTR